MANRISFSLLFLFFFGFISAQRFTSDSVKFVKELENYFHEFSADKKEASKWVDDFAAFWKKPNFSSNYKLGVYKMCNLMSTKKLKPTPYFKDYLNALGNYINGDHLNTNFENWQNCLEKILNGKNSRSFDNFLEMSLNLFSTNTFFKSPTYEWFSDNSLYKFDVDSVPRVLFSAFNLKGTNPRGDTIGIENTKGIFYPSTGRFYGVGGRIYWKRVGLESDVYAELQKINIDCKTGGYTLDSVVFFNPKYLQKSEHGRLTDKIMNEKENPTYPRFDSYNKRLIVKNVAPEVDFDGGFAMRGARFIGSGDKLNPAKLIFNREHKKFLEVSAGNFIMAKDKIVSDLAAIKFFLAKDSIIHPGLNFKYLIDQKKVSLIRNDDGLQKTPFYSSFHKMDMYFEEMIWKIEQPKIDFGFLPGNFQGEAFFESQDFFNRGRLSSLQGIEKINPIYTINSFYEQNNKKKSFTANDLAIYMKWLSVDLRPLIIKMGTFGLLFYDPATDVIMLREKLFNYIKAANKSRDYDVITIHSTKPGQSNATLNLVNNNFDIIIVGVKSVLLSDSQRVFIFPSDSQVILKKNRDFDFKGIVGAGKFEFYGKDFSFNYEKNKVDLKNVDSLRIYVEPFPSDELFGSGKFKKVETMIENINGELAIDHPNSHSGRLSKPEFPIFKSFKDSYAFYNKRNIQRGVYNKDKFYFKLDPFTIDSLDNFTNKALKFDGIFVSSDIFPEFKEALTLQKDYSLGFLRKTPEGGFTIYQGKAKFENEIKLSNKGLRGDGTIEFGPSLSKSTDFTYFPDSMIGIAQAFDVKETETTDEFPQVHGTDVKIRWQPYKDLMQVNDIKERFSSYNGLNKFHGRYDLSEKTLYGSGRAEFEKADLISQKILFKKTAFYSDTADFHLRSFDEEGFTFSTQNVKSTIDFVQRTGVFVSNGKGSLVKFDKNQYVCYMDRFKWYMDKEDIQIGDDKNKMNSEDAENGLNLEGPEFISVHPEQDSLRFFAPAAKYNLRKNIIECSNVPYINVADSRFFPDSGKVVIFKKAVIDTLKNARMITNTVTHYHSITKIKASIYGRRNYLANGDYTYLDENNAPYKIHFATIKPDTAGQTVSEGFIPEKDNFRFNDYFSFAGKVSLFATSQFLFFEGGTKIVHNCNRIGKSYLQFSGEINPKIIYIPIPKLPKDVNGLPAVNAIMYSPDTSGVYSGFATLKTGKNDKEIISSEGFLTFDKTSGEYRISNKEKLIEINLPGNFLSLNTSSCTVYGEGKFNIGADLGQVQTVTVGSAQHFSINDSAAIKLMMTINFFFEDKALKKMASDIEVFLNTLRATDFSKNSYNKGLTELMGKEKADKAIAELQLNGKFRRFPDSLEKSFFFNDLTFNYDAKSKSFGTSGELGLGNILKTEINRYVPGLIKIDKLKSGGDRMHIYIELDDATWYYFEYFKNVMKVVSSNEEFNTIIKEIKSKNKKQKIEKGTPFQFTTANKNTARTFVTKNGFKRN